MIYLSGKFVEDPRIGTMLSYRGGQRTDGHAAWAADNGCFARPTKYSDDGFLNWLDGMDRNGCLFAVAADVLGDAVATLERALPILPRIQKLGYPAAYVGQDGLTDKLIPWDKLDAFFVGGSTEWKLSNAAAQFVGEAKRRDKWVHMGRVNSWQRIRLASVLGCDSVDGNHLTFRPDRYTPVVIEWLERLEQQPGLKWYD